MPVFTRKMKVTTDATQNIENIPQQQTYDFSKMKMSQASAKGPRQEGEQDQKERGERQERPERQERGERTNRGDFGGRGRGGRGGFERGSDRPKAEQKESSDDSFEEVKEKRRGPQQFSRGGKNYGGKDL